MAQNNKTYPELHIRVAWYYYKAEMTQGEIANRLGINRARVIKILDQCRREGIVSFHVNSPSANCLELEKHVIGIAGGAHKVEAIKGALRGDYIHCLITDEKTALSLVKD